MSYANLYVYNGLMYTDIIIQNHNIYIYVLYILYIRYIDNMYSMFRYRQIIHLLTMAHIWSLPPKKDTEKQQALDVSYVSCHSVSRCCSSPSSDAMAKNATAQRRSET